MAGDELEKILDRASSREANQTRLFEELEDTLKKAIQLAAKVHLPIPTFEPSPGNNAELLGDYLRRALAEVNHRLDGFYAAEIRKQRGRE